MRRPRRRLRKKYEINSYPTLEYLAVDGTIHEYNGGRSEQDIMSNISREASTQCVAGRHLTHTADRVTQLDEIAEKFSKANSATESPEFIAAETARLAKIVQSGAVSRTKLDQSSIRHDIISAFSFAPAPKEEL
ncbi:hypothetical protein BGZ51_007079 [Haplosporangium sp. Z 767]|nr:hypothetical protein BGZ50_005078 [Haplosporangium sp. Z 11]KAF9194859.1 hypothetical protein BGZ51_007079 [Haplosporangium sp. Z 767]